MQLATVRRAACHRIPIRPVPTDLTVVVIEVETGVDVSVDAIVVGREHDDIAAADGGFDDSTGVPDGWKRESEHVRPDLDAANHCLRPDIVPTPLPSVPLTDVCVQSVPVTFEVRLVRGSAVVDLSGSTVGTRRLAHPTRWSENYPMVKRFAELRPT